MPESAQNNMTPELRINPAVREKTEPEINTVEAKGKKWFQKFGRATKDSTVKTDQNETQQERPLLTLSKRADFLRNYKNRKRTSDETPAERKSARSNAVELGKAWDEITEQYLTQGEVAVNLPGLGEQTARYTRLTPPESRKTSEAENKPPIFLIPGIANDLGSMGGLLMEAPMNGRKIDCVAFPESQMGNVTPEFADAVEKAPAFEPHVEFYKELFKKFYPDGQDVELWGFSNGAAIAETILHDPKFQERIPNAVLISPAGSADMSRAQLYVGGVLKEMLRYAPRLSKISKYGLTMSRKTPEPEGQRTLKQRIFANLEKKVTTNQELWKDARVRGNGKIVVVSGKKDGMTKSHTANESFLENPQVTLISVENGSHMTPLLEAEKIINAINSAQTPDASRELSLK